MNRLPHLLALLILAVNVAGCAMTRDTTTERTAIEVALLTKTADNAVNQLEIPRLDGQTYSITTDKYTAPEEDYIFTGIEKRLLLQGAARPVNEDEEPELDIQPRIDYAHIDDSKFLIGIPNIPVPIPGAGNFETPEIVLFGRNTQRGRSSVQVYAVENATGEIAFSADSKFDNRHYSRWRLLLFFGFRTTNLGKPF